ncbi:MAG: DNA topoisomerase, partial [Methanosarcinales archaeon]
IAGFFDGDGSIYKTKDTVNISIASKSEIFLRKLKLLLLTFSIHFRFHSNDIRIYHEDIKKFYKIIHKFTKIKKEKLEILCKNIKITKTSRLIYIPSDIVKNKIYEKNLKLKDIEKKIGRIRYSLNKNYRNCYYFTINKLRKLAYLLNDKYLISLANADVFWLPVKKIIKREFNFKVYDLTVSNRNFIANGIVSHNSDPAHEAIHPTIEPPKNINKLRGPEKKIYDLICRRYFTHFASEAVRESMKVTILVNKHKFFTTGRRTIEKGWMEFYGPYAKFDEIILPDLRKGDELNVKKLEMLSKETTPPPRYSQASIIKLLEQKNLGTRATRAAILQTLYDRNYVMGKSIKVTPLGLKLASTLKKYVPDFVDEKLTRKFEKELEKIMEGEAKKEKILKEAKKALIKICDEFKQHEKKIGRELGKAIVETQEDRSIVGPCPNCGRDLKRLFSPRTRKFFVGCTGYKDGCRTGYPLPHNSSIQRLDKICEKCNTPIIRVIRKGKRPFKMCLDPNCKSKENWGKPKKDKSG